MTELADKNYQLASRAERNPDMTDNTPEHKTTPPASDALVERLRRQIPYQGKSVQAFMCHEAADAIESLIRELTAAKAENELNRQVITEANNSLYGSQGYFLSLDGSPGHKYHLANGIEDLKAAARKAAKAKADAEMLVEENTRLRKYVDPEWFYLAGDMSSDRCRFSVHEVIDEDWLWDNRAEGFAVVQIETATRCPDIWALVHFFTDEEKDARQSDDEYEIIEFATEAEAKAALASYREKN